MPMDDAVPVGDADDTLETDIEALMRVLGTWEEDDHDSPDTVRCAEGYPT